MAIHVMQSQRIEVLFEAMLRAVQQPYQNPLMVLKAQHFIVPSIALETWLTQRLAEKRGISANNQFHHRIRGFQWWAYQEVLHDQRDEVRKANLPRLMIKWRIYQSLKNFIQSPINPLKQQHPLYPIIQRIYASADRLQGFEQLGKKQSMLYWVAEQVSRLFSNYMEYRSDCSSCTGVCQCGSNWLQTWSANQALQVEQLFFNVGTEIEQFQLEQATELEAWQRWLWHAVFAEDFKQVAHIDQLFWQRLDDPTTRQDALKRLPQQLVLFTLLDLPPVQLKFLRRLGQYLDIFVLHYNPSQEYWADMVDPHWKARYDAQLRQRFIEREQAQGRTVDDAAIQTYVKKFSLEFNAEKRDSHHPLLTRFGKQARDHFSLLASLSSNQEGQWFDLFPEDYPQTLLGKLQSDILNLVQPKPNAYVLAEDDDSIQIHVCHSSLRQLEVLKEQIIHWLSQSTAATPRRASDILVLCPNLKDIEPQIRSTFAAPLSERERMQHDSVYLPIQIAGVGQLDVGNAWRAVLGRIQLLQGRFTLEEFADWLSLYATQQRYGLEPNGLERMYELLQAAGFKRGFDALHLQESLSQGDEDYRFSFKFALDRLALGIAIPEHRVFNQTLSYAQVRPSDFSLIGCLIEIYQDIAARRTWLNEHETETEQSAEYWLNCLMDEINEFKAAGVEVLEQVYSLVKKQERMLTLTSFYDDDEQDALRSLTLPLPYILAEIEKTLTTQLEQAEPTGQITFSQMGQIRPVPYKLVVMLNLDSGKFPNRDQHIPFDLMQMLRPKLGDRSRLEDDQGAFLDALLLAKDNVWLFYNAFDLNDSEVRDPSSVVQEFVQHLNLITQKPAELPASVDVHGVEIASQLFSLYRIHPLQPFDPLGFSQQKCIRYQNQWFKVAKQLSSAKQPRPAWSVGTYQLTQLEPQLEVLDSEQWIQDILFPARSYLKNLGVKNLSPTDAIEAQEPLLLNGLKKYQLREFMLQQHRPEAELVKDILPVGKTQHATWQQSLLEQQQLLERLYVFAEAPTATTRQVLKLHAHLHISIQVPQQDTALWVNVLAASAKPKRRGRVWLEYLLWLAYLDLGEGGRQLQRVAVCSNKTLVCQGVSSNQAKQWLNDWLEAWHHAKQQPLVLPAELILKDEVKIEWIDTHGFMQVKDLDKLFKEWRKSDNFAGYRYDNEEWNIKHRDWQFILRDCDTQQLLEQACLDFSYRLYQPIFWHQVVQDAT
ncbi:exodeoxyribonuclease V subunit gamma [Acinetobacter sp. B51(2017)]|uniref:exodeoxyribonuclease V subunit gamma n=1 Tax=Acinetobacter sp. B51(2017) TaxID=2060938 RepID=UPI000F08467F|nr:exodeoxyribonuclease V subunit gamma [Acinetobacter sp. B51(2017)]